MQAAGHLHGVNVESAVGHPHTPHITASKLAGILQRCYLQSRLCSRRATVADAVRSKRALLWDNLDSVEPSIDYYTQDGLGPSDTAPQLRNGMQAGWEEPVDTVASRHAANVVSDASSSTAPASDGNGAGTSREHDVGGDASSASAFTEPESSFSEPGSSGMKEPSMNGPSTAPGDSTSHADNYHAYDEWGAYYTPLDWGETHWGQATAMPQENLRLGQQPSGQHAYPGSNAGSTTSTGASPSSGDNVNSSARGARAAGPDAFFTDGRQDSRFQAGTSSNTYASFQPSDITILSNTETGRVLPIAPTTRQLEFYQPQSLQERIIQVLGSVGASLVLSKSAALAGPALLYPIWSPWIRASLRNIEVYTRQFKYIGLWRAQVVEIEVVGYPYGGMFGADSRSAAVRLLAGDAWQGGARVQLEFPFQARAQAVRPGEPVELLVLSKDPSFKQFKVVREVYLPETGIWLAEYPFINRNAFLDISLRIETLRQEAVNEGQAYENFEYFDVGN